jgi:hypothetical protein
MCLSLIPQVETVVHSTLPYGATAMHPLACPVPGDANKPAPAPVTAKPPNSTACRANQFGCLAGGGTLAGVLGGALGPWFGSGEKASARADLKDLSDTGACDDSALGRWAGTQPTEPVLGLALALWSGDAARSDAGRLAFDDAMAVGKPSCAASRDGISKNNSTCCVYFIYSPLAGTLSSCTCGRRLTLRAFLPKPIRNVTG